MSGELERWSGKELPGLVECLRSSRVAAKSLAAVQETVAASPHGSALSSRGKSLTGTRARLLLVKTGTAE